MENNFLKIDEKENMKLSAKYLHHDVGNKIECNLSKSEIIEIGKNLIIEWEADIESESIYVARNPNEVRDIEKIQYRDLSFGIYCVFTVPTQHFCCSQDDIPYILGLSKIYKDAEDNTVSGFYSDYNEKAMNLAIGDELRHMRDICDKSKIKIPDELVVAKEIEDYLDDNHYIDAGNYFYDLRMGAYTKYYYEDLMGIQ